MKVHTSEKTIKLYASHGWSRLMASQMATENALIEEREDAKGTFFRVVEGEIIVDRLMPMISSVIHYHPYALVTRSRWRKFLTERRFGTKEDAYHKQKVGV